MSHPLTPHRPIANPREGSRPAATSTPAPSDPIPEWHELRRVAARRQPRGESYAESVLRRRVHELEALLDSAARKADRDDRDLAASTSDQLRELGSAPARTGTAHGDE